MGSEIVHERVYRIRGTLWRQEELTYPQDGQIREMLEEVDQAFVGLDPSTTSMGVVTAKLYDAGLIPKLFGIILRPHHANPGVWLKNVVLRFLFRLDREDLPTTGRMKNSEIVEVVKDFFLLNTQWMWPSSTSPSASGSATMNLLQTMMGPSASTSPSTSSPAAT